MLKVEGIDFCFLSDAKDKTLDATKIKILTGNYKGTIFHFGKVKFVEENEQIRLQFAYYVISCDLMKPKALENDTDFKQYAGDLLVQLMSANLEEDIIDETIEETDDL